MMGLGWVKRDGELKWGWSSETGQGEKNGLTGLDSKTGQFGKRGGVEKLDGNVYWDRVVG